MKLIINIDCAPGTPRPGDVARQIGMKWGSKRYQEGHSNGEFDNTSRFFGNWVFEKTVESKEAGFEEGREFFEKLKPLYPGTIRYADYHVEE